MTYFFGIWGIMAILEKLGPNALDHGLGNRKSNSKFSAPYFTSITEVSRPSEGKLYLFERVFGPLGTIWANWVKIHNSQTEKHEEWFKVFNCTFHIKGGFAQL